MAPYCCTKTERAEQDEDSASGNDQPLRNNSRKQRLRSNTARQGHEAGAHPSSVGALGGKYRAVGRELGRACRAVLDAVRAAFDLFSALGELFFSPLRSNVCFGTVGPPAPGPWGVDLGVQIRKARRSRLTDLILLS